MDFHAERVIAEEFMKFLMNGSLYQGSKPVMWSPVEKTALAEAEVEYHDRQTDAVWVPFRLCRLHREEASPEGIREQRGQLTKLATLLQEYGACRSVIIWTTTPWTLPQNRAICFGPDIGYGLYEITGRPEECWARIGDRYLMADALAEEALHAARGWSRHVSPPARRDGRGTGVADLRPPLRGAEGANGEWDYDVPLFPAITSPTTRARASSTPRPATATTTTRSGASTGSR
jgi:isoleucyl-tRNA synthetase